VSRDVNSSKFSAKPEKSALKMATDEPKLKYRWRVTWPTPEDADSHKTDFCGWDGDIRVGRIRLEPQGLKKGQWRWSGQGPEVRERILPHQGTDRPTPHSAGALHEYFCEHEGCKKWGSQGYDVNTVTKWFCYQHRWREDRSAYTRSRG
jgi:hypothetical protein